MYVCVICIALNHEWHKWRQYRSQFYELACSLRLQYVPQIFPAHRFVKRSWAQIPALVASNWAEASTAEVRLCDCRQREPIIAPSVRLTACSSYGWCFQKVVSFLKAPCLSKDENIICSLETGNSIPDRREIFGYFPDKMQSNFSQHNPTICVPIQSPT